MVVDPAVLTLLGTLAAALGLTLFLVGWRGRAVDDHPVCRRCGFDLSGTPDAPRCNECGRELTKRPAVRIGNRQRRRWAIAAGSALLLPVLGVLLLVGYGTATDVDWQHHKPAWWLAREIRGDDESARLAALREFSRRHTLSELSEAGVDSAVDAILDWQADLTQPWAKAAGDFVTAEQEAGRLSEERWARYLKQAFDLELVTRPHVRQGDDLPMKFRVIDWRGGTYQRFITTATWEQVSLDDRPLEIPAGSAWINVSDPSKLTNVPAGTIVSLMVKPDIDAVQTVSLSPGSHTLSGRLHLEIGTYARVDQSYTEIVYVSQNSDGTRSARLVQDPDARKSTRVTAAFDVDPSDTPLRSLVDDALRPKMQGGTVVSAIAPDGQMSPHYGGAKMLTVGGEITPVRVIATVWLRYDGQEAQVTPALWDGAASTRDNRFAISMTGAAAALAEEAAARGDTVTIVLRPRLEMLPKLIFPEPVWGEVLVVPNVPVLDTEPPHPLQFPATGDPSSVPATAPTTRSAAFSPG